MLRFAGWRFSATRDAWVHRIGRGRYGPVFVARGAEPTVIPEPDPSIYEALVASRRPKVTVPPEQRPPLPQRAPAPSVAGPQALGRGSERPKVRVEVQLDEAEPPRTVIVDGRPPERGIDPRVLGKGGVVVRLHKRRASA
jgi:hypothetical protein